MKIFQITVCGYIAAHCETKSLNYVVQDLLIELRRKRIADSLQLIKSALPQFPQVIQEFVRFPNVTDIKVPFVVMVLRCNSLLFFPFCIIFSS